MQLESSAAVISGGASGLGLATARKIVAAGGKAVLLDINEEQGRASAAELGSLRKLQGSFDRAEVRYHIDEYSEANIKFHRRILEMSKCTILKDMADGLFLHMRAIRARTMTEDDRAVRSIVDHIHIIGALEARDAELAERLVREHTLKLHDHVKQTWVEPEQLQKVAI